jgi:glutathione synthase/RimK-type ligase-like ATP-grasp enzyme
LRAPRSPKPSKYDMAILVDPEEKLPPSDADAIEKFVDAAEDQGFSVELIEREDFGRVAEFDALFIRVTTSVNHFSYRFARRAAAEGLVVIDDPDSIVRCTNKVFLAELLERHRLRAPKTVIFAEQTAGLVAERIGFPCVVKQPDGSFSTGVKKFETHEAFDAALPALFEQSELLLAQEFVPTPFDWRVGVLDGEPLYVCKYHMARAHWQIIKHDEGGGAALEGLVDTFRVDEAPEQVVQLGVRAAKAIGDGLYGVDIKEVRGRPMVIEINDNPSIDHGFEDKALGDELYRKIMGYFVKRLEERRAAAR